MGTPRSTRPSPATGYNAVPDILWLPMAEIPALLSFPHGITAVDTDYVRPRLDASHLLVRGGRGAFVDTGTSHSVPALLRALASKDLDPADVDYVFLTHIHLDHAGGAGELMRYLPNAKVVVHPRGAAHVVNPDKLIAGTKAVYGEAEFARLYGEIPGIAAERVVEAPEGLLVKFGGSDLLLIHTPGHALHHYCIVDQTSDSIFTGDTFGISYRVFDTAKGSFIFPATTPVHFNPEQAHASLDRLMEFEPSAVCSSPITAAWWTCRVWLQICMCVWMSSCASPRGSRTRAKRARRNSRTSCTLTSRNAHVITGANWIRRSWICGWRWTLISTPKACPCGWTG